MAGLSTFWSLMNPAVRLLLLGSKWTPARLFTAGEQGGWWDPSDFSTMFQDSAGTSPVTATGQPVGLILDKSGRGNHRTQSTAASRPVLQQDSSGYYYLAYDGADDGMATAGNVDLSATDKVSVFVGLRKTSDAAVGFFLYTSINFTTNAGALTIRAPSSAAGSNYGMNVSGAGGNEQINSSTAYAAPISNVFAGVLDLGGNSAVIRINGQQDATKSLTTGPGPFGNYPIFIARSGVGVTNLFAGREYQTIIRGAASNATQIQQAERFVGSRMGIAL